MRHLPMKIALVAEVESEWVAAPAMAESESAEADFESVAASWLTTAAVNTTPAAPAEATKADDVFATTERDD